MNCFIAGILGGWEIAIVVLAVVLLFFGGKKLPELARGLGLSVKEFKKGAGMSETDATKPEAPTEEPKGKS
jgi:sec-independent protein translocase protein TatA